MDAVDEKALHSGFSDILELLAFTINKISCEVIYNQYTDFFIIILTIFNIISLLYRYPANVLGEGMHMQQQYHSLTHSQATHGMLR